MKKEQTKFKDSNSTKEFYVDENTSYHAEPDCKYCVKKRINDKGGWRIVAHIPDYLQNPKGVAQGLAEILNRERRLILPIN